MASLVCTYAYDALGRRIAEEVNADNNAAFTASGETLIYDGTRLIETANISGAACHEQLVWNPLAANTLILRDRDADNDAATGSYGMADSGMEERLYALHDPKGSVTALVAAGTTPAVVERFRYDPFGASSAFTAALVARTNGQSAYAWEVGFGGQIHDLATNLYCFPRRWYDPFEGRFISRDPLGYIDGSSLYQFCGSDPVDHVDPLGFCSDGYWYNVGQVFKGEGMSVVGAVEGLYGIARHPINAAEGIGTLFAHPINSANAMIGMVESDLATSEGQGQLAGDVLQMFVGTGEVKLAEEVVEVGQVAHAAEEASEAVQGAEEVAGVVEEGGQGSASIEAVPETPSSGASAATESESVGADTADAETYYRTMKQSHYDQLLETGEIPATGETFISPSLEYAQGYEGVTVQFDVKAGTTDQLLEIGVRNPGLSGGVYDSLPLAQSGWGESSALFKQEGDVVNIGLGKGSALDLFNNNIMKFTRIGAQ